LGPQIQGAAIVGVMLHETNSLNTNPETPDLNFKTEAYFAVKASKEDVILPSKGNFINQYFDFELLGQRYRSTVWYSRI